MATSQNGYTANDRSLIATYTIPGTKVRISLRKGDVSVVLLDFFSWFDKNIQKLRQEDTGGYAERTIRGNSKEFSNHASGTAGDVRWKDHPLGAVGTFTDAQEKKIQAKLKTYDDVIRWGGNYKGRKDEMHFEINKNKAAVAAVVRKIKGTPAPTPNTGHIAVDGVLGKETIKRWQKVMKNPSGVTGVWSSRWVSFLQTYLRETVDHRLKVDGDWGPNSIRALQRYLRAPVDGIISKPKSVTIVALQRRLNEGRF